MKREVDIVIAEDDEGHATLIRKNLKRSGVSNRILWFKDGQKTLDFFFSIGDGPHREIGTPYLLLLDLRMPKVDGVEVIRQLKQDSELRKIPIIVITTTDDPREVENCHSLGCSNYITKPIDYEKFVVAIRQLGLFLMVVEVPDINGVE